MLVPTGDGPGGLLFAGIHTVQEAPANASADEGINVGVTAVRASTGLDDVSLGWSLEDFRSLLATDERSAAARATYMGMQMRLQRVEDKSKKRPRADD